MKQRIEYFDLAKGICMFLVVFFHLSTTFPNVHGFLGILGKYRLCLFFFLSGCFFRTRDDFRTFFVKKARRLLIPYVFFYVTLSCFLPRILYDWIGFNWRPLQYHEFLTAFVGNSYPNIPIWFLLCLFCINLTMYPVARLDQRWHCRGLLLLAFAMLLHVLSQTVLRNSVYLIQVVSSNCLYYVAGFLVFTRTSLMQPQRFNRLLPLQALVAVGLAYAFAQWQLPLHLAWYLSACSGIYAVLALCKCVVRLPFFSFIGRNSLIVLVTHCFLYVVLCSLVRSLHLTASAKFFVLTPIVFLSYYVIVPLMRRFLPFAIGESLLTPVATSTASRSKDRPV